jgi:hypothetical protein
VTLLIAALIAAVALADRKSLTKQLADAQHGRRYWHDRTKEWSEIAAAMEQRLMAEVLACDECGTRTKCISGGQDEQNRQHMVCPQCSHGADDLTDRIVEAAWDRGHPM